MIGPGIIDINKYQLLMKDRGGHSSSTHSRSTHSSSTNSRHTISRSTHSSSITSSSAQSDSIKSRSSNSRKKPYMGIPEIKKNSFIKREYSREAQRDITN